MRVFKIIAFLLFTASMFAQDGMEITLKNSNNASCVSIILTSDNPEDILLRGQNYRLFYNNDNVAYTSVNVHSEMALNHFDAEIALHRDGLSKEIHGNIPFETNMGFISMNVMPEDEIADFVYMAGNESRTIADVCFDRPVNLEDIILAERGVTSEYSAAYSVVDWDAASPTDKKVLYTIDLPIDEGSEK